MWKRFILKMRKHTDFMSWQTHKRADEETEYKRSEENCESDAKRNSWKLSWVTCSVCSDLSSKLKLSFFLRILKTSKVTEPLQKLEVFFFFLYLYGRKSGRYLAKRGFNRSQSIEMSRGERKKRYSVKWNDRFSLCTIFIFNSHGHHAISALMKSLLPFFCRSPLFLFSLSALPLNSLSLPFFLPFSTPCC